MTRNRMEAFSDGVLAIVITVMVLKLNAPAKIDINSIKEVFPTLLAYILSYIYVGIYWANHHHLVSVLESVSGRVLWKNLHWIFWMTLIPTATEWAGLNPFVNMPVMFYGVILFMCAVSYNMLQNSIIDSHGKDSAIAESIGKDVKGKISIFAYGIGIIISLLLPIVAYIVYAGIALLWIIPDTRIEKVLRD